MVGCVTLRYTQNPIILYWRGGMGTEKSKPLVPLVFDTALLLPAAVSGVTVDAEQSKCDAAWARSV